jgi:uncharacterized protein YggE
MQMRYRALIKKQYPAKEISDSLQSWVLSIRKTDIQLQCLPMTDYGLDDRFHRPYFVVENTVYVTVRNLSSLVRCWMRCGSGANTSTDSFDVLDKDAAIAQARDLAIENAREQAKAIAESAGVKLGDLQTVNVWVSSGTTPVYTAKGIGGAMDSSSVPVAAGQLMITVEANITYEIK